MKVSICYSQPHKPLFDLLADALGNGGKLKAAIAFVTRRGVDFLREHFKGDRFQLIVSIRWPTDLDALARIANEYPDSIWLHMGGFIPQEKKAERFQLHSKVVCIENNGNVDLFIGSHNWTATALHGINLEAGVHIRCGKDEEVAKDLIEHINECQSESQKFDPNQLSFYKEVQNKLHRSPNREEDQDIDGFIREQTLVIHAEAEQNCIFGLSSLQLFMSPLNFGIEDTFLFKKVDLYLYPPKTLFGHTKPIEKPVFYTGKMTMMNDPNDAPVEHRDINSKISSIHHPKIELQTDISDDQNPGLQIVMKLEKEGEKYVNVYHRGKQPKISSRVEKGEIYHPQKWVNDEKLFNYFRGKKGASSPLCVELPEFLFEEIELDIPSNKIVYPDDPLEKLRSDSRYHREFELKKTPPQFKWETDYFYIINYTHDK